MWGEFGGSDELTPCRSGLVLDSPGVATITDFSVTAPWGVREDIPGASLRILRSSSWVDSGRGTSLQGGTSRLV